MKEWERFILIKRSAFWESSTYDSSTIWTLLRYVIMEEGQLQLRIINFLPECRLL